MPTIKAPEPVVTPAFTAGEVVQLRSGGPLLTVTYCKSTSATAIYYNSVSGLYETVTTHEDCLKHANTSPSIPADARGLRHTTITKSSMS